MSISSLKTTRSSEQIRTQEVLEDYDIYKSDITKHINQFKNADNKAADYVNFSAYEKLFDAEKYGFIDQKLVNNYLGRKNEEMGKGADYDKIHHAIWMIEYNRDALLEGAYDDYEQMSYHLSKEADYENKTGEILFSEESEKVFESRRNLKIKLIDRYFELQKLIGDKGDKYFRKESLEHFNKNGTAQPILTPKGLNLIDMHDAGIIDLEKDTKIRNFEEKYLFDDHRNFLTEDINKIRGAYKEGIIKDRQQYLGLVKEIFQEHQKKMAQREKLDSLQRIYEKSPNIETRELNYRVVEKRFPQIKQEFAKPEIKEKIDNIIKISESDIGFNQKLNLSQPSNPAKRAEVEQRLTQRKQEIQDLEKKQMETEQQLAEAEAGMVIAKQNLNKQFDKDAQPYIENIKDVWENIKQNKKIDFKFAYKNLIGKYLGDSSDLTAVVETQRPHYNQIETLKPQIEEIQKLIEQKNLEAERDKVFILSDQITQLKETVLNKIIYQEGEDNIIPREKVELEQYVIDELIKNYKHQPDKGKFVDEISALNEYKKLIINNKDRLYSREDFLKFKSIGAQLSGLERVESKSYFDINSEISNILDQVIKNKESLDAFKRTFSNIYNLELDSQFKLHDDLNIEFNNKNTDNSALVKEDNEKVIKMIFGQMATELFNYARVNKKKYGLTSKILSGENIIEKKMVDYATNVYIKETINSEGKFAGNKEKILNKLRNLISGKDMTRIDRSIIDNLISSIGSEQEVSYEYFNNFQIYKNTAKFKIIEKIIGQKGIEKIFSFRESKYTLREVKNILSQFSKPENITEFNSLFNHGGMLCHITSGSAYVLKDGYQASTRALNLRDGYHEGVRRFQHPSAAVHNSYNGAYFDGGVEHLLKDWNMKCPGAFITHPVTHLMKGRLIGGHIFDINNSITFSANDVGIRGKNNELVEPGTNDILDEHKITFEDTVFMAPKNLKMEELIFDDNGDEIPIEKRIFVIAEDQSRNDLITSEEYFNNLINELPKEKQPRGVFYFDVPQNTRAININFNDGLDLFRKKNNIDNAKFKDTKILMESLNKEVIRVKSPTTGIDYNFLAGFGDFSGYKIPENEIQLEKNYSQAINNNISISTFKNYERITGNLGGNTDGGKFKINEVLYDKEYYLKFMLKPNRRINESQEEYDKKVAEQNNRLWHEQLADNIYRKLGVDVPETEIINFQAENGETKLARASEWKERKHSGYDEKIFNDGFIADCLLANWDAPLNQYVATDGKAYRIDNGGSMLFRSRGDRKKLSRDFNPAFDKEDQYILWEDKVVEIDSLRKNGKYPGLTQSDIARQINNIEQNLSDDDIERLTYTVKLEFDDRKLLQEILRKRRDYLINNKQQILAKFPENNL